MNKKEFWFLAIILAVAVFFRFYLINHMPGGLFPDEAANGLDINNIFKGHWQPFFPRGNGREALFFYFEALSVYFFGRGVWQFHIVSATIGVLSVFAVYLMTSRLFNRSTGLVAAFLMAVGTWHIVLSRTALRAIEIPLFISLAIYFMVRTIQAQSKKEQIWSAIFFGIFFAGGFYTYIAYRIMVGIIGIAILVLLVADKKQGWLWLKKYAQAFWIALVAGFITFIPLGWYFLTHPGSFLGRSGQVSIFNPNLNGGSWKHELLVVFQKTILSYFTNGDLNWRQNISGQPFLSPLISIFFGATLVICTWLAAKFIWQACRGKQNNADIKYLLLGGLFWGMMVPEITTAEGIPHGLRLIGTLPEAYIFAAVGIVWLGKKVMQLWHPKWMEYLYLAVAVLYFATLGFLSYTQYFVYAYNVPENFEAFRSDLTSVSGYLNTNPDKAQTYLVLDRYSVQTVDYLTTTTDNPYIIIDPANSPKLHLRTGDKVIFTGSTIPDLVNFMKVHKDVYVGNKDVIKNKFDQIDMAVLHITQNESSDSVANSNDLSFNIVNFGDRIDFSWKNLSFNPWSIRIWQCDNSKCDNAKILKENNQNDYLGNYDYILADGTKSDLYFHAISYDQHGGLLKDYGIIRLPQYK